MLGQQRVEPRAAPATLLCKAFEEKSYDTVGIGQPFGLFGTRPVETADGPAKIMINAI